MKACEQIDPSFDGIDGDLNLARKVGIDELLCTVFRENLYQCFQSSEIGHTSRFAQVFARQLFISQGTPTPSEPRVATKEWLRKSSVLPQRVPVRRAHFLGSVNFFFGQIGSQAFRHAPGMHAVKKVTTHQAVAPSPENLDARASCNNEAYSVAVAVEKAFQQPFPFGVFVQFVERGDWRLRPEDIQVQGLCERCRS